MKKIRITVMRMASYPELSAAYENPLTHSGAAAKAKEI